MLVGTTKRITMMKAAPSTCHQTDTLFMIAIRCPLKMLSTEAIASSTRKIRKTG